MCVEVLQLVTGRGYFQIDDLMTNTLGALIGFLIFALAREDYNGKGKIRFHIGEAQDNLKMPTLCA